MIVDFMHQNVVLEELVNGALGSSKVQFHRL